MTALLEKQVEGRQGGWIQLSQGGRIWPLDPRPEEINIQDIAHALGNLCRFGGHVRRFYSVAQHSIIVADLLRDAFGPEMEMYGLLHDASEAYLIDVPRPIKHSLDMQPYRDAEQRMEEAICQRFGLNYPMPPEIKWADRVALRNEQIQLMEPPLPEWEEDRYSEAHPFVKIEVMDPGQARMAFFYRYLEIRDRDLTKLAIVC